MADMNELRVQVELLEVLRKQVDSPSGSTFSFCINRQCLEEGVQFALKKFSLPQFKGSIRIPPDLSMVAKVLKTKYDKTLDYKVAEDLNKT